MPIDYNDISRMKIAPISELWLYYPQAEDAPLYRFSNLEEGSTMSFSPILVPNDLGGETIVAWEQKIDAVILENDYETKAQLLVNLASERLSDVEVILEALPKQQSGAKMHVSPDAYPSLGVRRYNLTFSIDFASEVPRLNISITGIMSIELFNTVYNVEHLFNQQSGY